MAKEMAILVEGLREVKANGGTFEDFIYNGEELHFENYDLALTALGFDGTHKESEFDTALEALFDSIEVEKHRKNYKPITPEMERALVGKLVGVHWNAHENCWSVVNFKTRKTVATLAGHTDTLILYGISFKVDLSKKRKAFEKGSKDRHTFIVGVFMGIFKEFEPMIQNKLYYHANDNEHPFKDSFGDIVTGEEAYFSPNGKVFVI